jgi:hypothetical protein
VRCVGAAQFRRHERLEEPASPQRLEILGHESFAFVMLGGASREIGPKFVGERDPVHALARRGCGVMQSGHFRVSQIN